MSTPRLTDRVLRGITNACAFLLAGTLSNENDTDEARGWADSERAQEWAWAMQAQREGREPSRPTKDEALLAKLETACRAVEADAKDSASTYGPSERIKITGATMGLVQQALNTLDDDRGVL